MAAISHFEIHAHEPAACAAFYAALFDWPVERMSDEYWRMSPAGGPMGLVFYRRGAPPEHGQPLNACVLSVQTRDLDAVVLAARARGAEMRVPRYAAGDAGWCCYMADPFGNLFGLFEPKGEAAR